MPPRLPYEESFWLRLAEGRGFCSEMEMWKGLYLGAGGDFPLRALADELGLDYRTVRSRLVLYEIAITAPLLAPAELDGILAEGIAAAARRLNMRYKSLHHLVTRSLKARRRAAVAARESQE